VKRAGFAAVLVLLGLSACTGSPSPQPPAPVHLEWQQLTLPAAPSGERNAVRAATTCDGHWYLTGSYVDSSGGTKPAAWESTDLRAFTAMRMDPNTFYGRQNTLYAAGCRNGRLAALGAKAGGAHGFPRTSNWYEDAGGVMRQIEAVYTLYGGPDGVNVSHIVGSGRGWIETGNRTTGAAAWLSQDAAAWKLVDHAPTLATDAQTRTWASDVVSTRDGWLIVGSATAAGSADGHPAVWPSFDGLTWTRVDLTGVPGYEEIQRAAANADEVVGVGVQASGFAAWRGKDTGQGWIQVGSFGTNGGAGRGFVAGLAAVGDRLLAAVSDGTTYALWRSTDAGGHWQEVVTPARMPANANANTTLISDSSRILLIVDDGRTSVIYAGSGSTTG
jgi:hypothetical protein